MVEGSCVINSDSRVSYVSSTIFKTWADTQTCHFKQSSKSTRMIEAAFAASYRHMYDTCSCYIFVKITSKKPPHNATHFLSSQTEDLPTLFSHDYTNSQTPTLLVRRRHHRPASRLFVLGPYHSDLQRGSSPSGRSCAEALFPSLA